MAIKKKKRICTVSREIYKKFHDLNFTSEVVLRDVSDRQIQRILSSINKDMEVLESQKIGDLILIKRKRPLNFEVYLR